MASQDYNRHPLPALPPNGNPQQQYSYGQPSLPQPSPAAQPYQQRSYQQQASYAQDPQYESRRQQPQQQYPERNRPRSRGFSFRSDKSQKTEKSRGSAIYKSTSTEETHEEKESKRLHSKADPTLAMQEAEPSAVAAQSGKNFTENPPLSAIQHKDPNGNPIADPDRSNPTRSRWERPLDTIRSFEAAIDGSYRRQSIYRSDTESVVNFNRRNSYYGSELARPRRNHGGTSHRSVAGNNGPRFPQDSYYGSRPPSAMLDSRGHPRDGYFEGYENNGYNGGPSNGYNGGRNRYPSRMNSEPYVNTHPAMNKNVYPMPGGNQRSYETVASGSGGSGSMGEPAGYQTDPTSSENSSLNRRSPPKRQEPMNDYGISFGAPAAGYQPPTFAAPASQPRTMPDDSLNRPPPPPQKDSRGGSLLRKGSRAEVLAADAGEKRKSWFSRRFSKTS
ncbi:hypothetical protein BX600DRAFT_432139 [Xylariales sp. PMI_506]|nr:hypothetical protein BX600DRAFT_432139 [Xylariales sp. PMI_506]